MKQCHGTVSETDQTANAGSSHRRRYLRRDSCHRRLDSCTGLGDNALGRKIFTARALDVTPVTHRRIPPALRLEQISSPVNRRLPALCHVPECVHHVTVNLCDSPWLAGVTATTLDTKPLRQYSSPPPAAARHRLNSRPPLESPIN
jgi:hypothetical protein